LRLVACGECHTQFDVTHLTLDRFDCRCGATVENVRPTGIDAEVRRCRSCGASVTANAEACDYCGSAIIRDDKKLSLICPECYARNEEQSRFCAACGVAFRPEPVPSASEELPCVKCECPMPMRRVGGLLVRECPRCHGLWAPGESFEELVNRAIEVQRGHGSGQLPGSGPRVKGGNPVAEPVQYRKCPACGVLMQRKNFRQTSGVVIDRCHAHGTWLDADELEQIAGFVLSGGLERSPGPRGLGAEKAKREARAKMEFQRILMERRTSSREVKSTLLETFGQFLGELFP
jgi:Zn-finger nucleic acid-binding protein